MKWPVTCHVINGIRACPDNAHFVSDRSWFEKGNKKLKHSHTHLLDTCGQLWGVVCYQFVYLFPWASNDWETIHKSLLKSHWSTHGVASPVMQQSYWYAVQCLQLLKQKLTLLRVYVRPIQITWIAIIQLTYKSYTHISVTASPTPQNLASSSMPSSLITVLSTSKQTASALRKISFVCDKVVIMLKQNMQESVRQKYNFALGQSGLKYISNCHSS